MKKSVLGSAVAVLAGAMLTTNPAAAESICANGGVTSYPPPHATDGPVGLTAGPGGTWYAEGDRIVRIRGNGKVDQFELPDPLAADAGRLTWPGGDKVWFSDRGTGRLGTIEGHGHVVEYQIPDGANGTPVPQGLVVGPGPHVW